MPTTPVTRPPRLPAGTTVVVGVLLAVPLIALAAVPMYSRETPVLWGFPFFYWYQLLWVLITPVLTYAAYKLIKRARSNGEARLQQHEGDVR
ncbi:MAG TPA: DUF3311 domain-containing protein [Jatrophihabitans sp.]|uniref:DUF3311 domain-containing protein n=1 Tax=Jatrophihabitans sp. TaxID=1932789 RepID=UPI002DFB4B21|nr:DUF3311 domain-containing protein [Jatrophihabitans sp.]